MTKDQVKAALRYALSTTSIDADVRTFMEALMEVAADKAATHEQDRTIFVVMADRAWTSAVADGSDPVFTAEGSA